MRIFPQTVSALALIAVATLPASGTALAQDQAPGENGVLTTVIGSPPTDFEGLVEGPEVSGFISARNDNKVRVTIDFLKARLGKS